MAENGRPTKTLSWRQRRFIVALMGAPTIQAAARVAHIGERTAWRYLADPLVRAEIASRQDGMLAQATAGIVQDVALARAVLRKVMADKEATAGVRVRAAGVILTASLRFAELVTLAQRVAAIERWTAERGASEWARK